MKSHFRYVVLHMYPRQTHYRRCYITSWNNVSFKTSFQTLYTRNAHMWIRCTMTLLGRCMTSDLRTRRLQKFHSFHISRGGETSHKASGKLRKNQGLKETAGRFLDTFALHLGVVADPCVSVCSENCCIVCRCAEVLPRDTGPRDTAGLKPYCVLQGPLSSHSLKPEGGMPTLALSALSKTQLGCLPGWPTFVYKDHIWSLHELIEFSIIYFSPKLHRMATQVLLKSHLDCYLQQVNSWRL